MRVQFSPAQLALVFTVLGAALSAGVEVIRHGTGAVDWAAVAVAAVLAGVGAFTQSHRDEPIAPLSQQING